MIKAFDKFNLINKTALITGAAGLLGVEHAIALLGTGASVVLTDIDEIGLFSAKLKLEKKFNKTKIVTKLMDVSNSQSIHKVANELWSDSIHVDILINNAAIDYKVNIDSQLTEISRMENFPIERWDLEIAVGLTGAFLCSQVFGSEMAKVRSGVILNISSDLSVISPDQRLYRRDEVLNQMQPVKPVTYSVIKTGLIGLTRYLATYWANEGIRSNALSPGGILDSQDDTFVQRLSNLIPLGRMARADEYHSAIQFLCSDASQYLTGQNIVMDGGRSIW